MGFLFISLGFNMWREVVVHGSAQLKFRTAFSPPCQKYSFHQHSYTIDVFLSTNIFVHAELVQFICGLDGVPVFDYSSPHQSYLRVKGSAGHLSFRNVVRCEDYCPSLIS